MRYFSFLIVTCLCFVSSASFASDITLYSVGVPNVVGDTTTSAPGFASGSWQAAAMSPGQKSEVYIPTNVLFATPVKISDIKSVSYWTNKPGSAAGTDWAFIIYTALEGTGDTGSFYNTRLNSEPYFTNTSSVAANTWHQWATDDATNPLRFYDANRDGVPPVFGTYTDPTLSDLKSGPITWPTSGTTVDYRSKVVSMFSFQTGSGWADGFTGKIDGATVTLNDGSVGTVNFEAALAPTPLPSSAMAGGVLLGGLGLARRRKRAV